MVPTTAEKGDCKIVTIRGETIDMILGSAGVCRAVTTVVIDGATGNGTTDVTVCTTGAGSVFGEFGIKLVTVTTGVVDGATGNGTANVTVCTTGVIDGATGNGTTDVAVCTTGASSVFRELGIKLVKNVVGTTATVTWPPAMPRRENEALTQRRSWQPKGKLVVGRTEMGVVVGRDGMLVVETVSNPAVGRVGAVIMGRVG